MTCTCGFYNIQSAPTTRASSCAVVLIITDPAPVTPSDIDPPVRVRAFRTTQARVQAIVEGYLPPGEGSLCSAHPSSPPIAFSSSFSLSLFLSLSLYPPLSSSWTGGTAIGQDERPGGSGLLHHVPIVSAISEGSDVDRAGSTGGICVCVRRGQATGRNLARMGRLSGPIPGQV